MVPVRRTYAAAMPHVGTFHVPGKNITDAASVLNVPQVMPTFVQSEPSGDVTSAQHVELIGQFDPSGYRSGGQVAELAGLVAVSKPRLGATMRPRRVFRPGSLDDSSANIRNTRSLAGWS